MTKREREAVRIIAKAIQRLNSNLWLSYGMDEAKYIAGLLVRAVDVIDPDPALKAKKKK